MPGPHGPRPAVAHPWGATCVPRPLRPPPVLDPAPHGATLRGVHMCGCAHMCAPRYRAGPAYPPRSTQGPLCGVAHAARPTRTPPCPVHPALGCHPPQRTPLAVRARCVHPAVCGPCAHPALRTPPRWAAPCAALCGPARHAAGCDPALRPALGLRAPGPWRAAQPRAPAPGRHPGGGQAPPRAPPRAPGHPPGGGGGGGVETARGAPPPPRSLSWNLSSRDVEVQIYLCVSELQPVLYRCLDGVPG
jgi:hypothetical protein